MSLVERAQDALHQGHLTEHHLEAQLDRLRDPQARAEEERSLIEQLDQTREVTQRLHDRLVEMMVLLAGCSGAAEPTGVLGELVGDPLDRGESEGGDVG